MRHARRGVLTVNAGRPHVTRRTADVRRPRWTGRDVTWLIVRLRRLRNRFRPTTLSEIERERDPFRLLVACIISLRTQDAVTARASARLFAAADTPRAVAEMNEASIARLIYPAGFYNTKAKQIRAIAQQLQKSHQGRVPADIEGMLALSGVGRKTANLVLGLGFGVPAICVDTHVHRISNRLGLVRTRTPEETEHELEAVLPQRHWIDINDLLVTFGQNVCHPISPRCSECPLAERCPRIGVKRSR